MTTQRNGKDLKYLVLIPARGGSKGIPKKNIKFLGGKPLIAHTIEAAKRSKYRKNFDLVCSTDDPQIARVAKRYGCPVPFIRPKKFASDKATSISVAKHALKFMEDAESKQYDYLVLLQPTSPLRKKEHIDEAINLIQKKKCDSVVSVVEPDYSPFIMKRATKQGYLKDLLKEKKTITRRQDLKSIYVLNGAIYIADRDTILKRNSFYGRKTAPYLMERDESIDIDDMDEFQLAAKLLKLKKATKRNIKKR